MININNLYNNNKNKVLSFLYKLTHGDVELSRDLLHDTYIKAIESIKSFDESKSELSWLFGISQHVFIDYIRHKTIENNFAKNITEDKLTFIGEKYNPNEYENNEQLDMVNNIIKHEVSKQPEIKQKIFELRINEGKSFKDISKELNYNINNCLGYMSKLTINLTKKFKEVKLMNKNFFEINEAILKELNMMVSSINNIKEIIKNHKTKEEIISEQKHNTTPLIEPKINNRHSLNEKIDLIKNAINNGYNTTKLIYEYLNQQLNKNNIYNIIWYMNKNNIIRHTGNIKRDNPWEIIASDK
jgi:RNA polymerase sigma factor (sigma-70 family)